MTTDTLDYWELLEDHADGCEAVADLFHWSTNYDAGRGPATLFLDLIGRSEDQLGENIYPYADVSSLMGYLELSKLASALEEYACRPHDVRAYVERLMEAESNL